MKDLLPDLLCRGLFAVICGTAAGKKSAALKAYYADGRNRFWAVLKQCDLTTEELKPEQFNRLLEFGLGLTDIAKTASGVDSNLRRDAFDVETFKKSIERYQPRIVAFNGKKAARVFYGLPSHQKINYGRGPVISDFPVVFVLPSTSGSAWKYWEPEPWQEFRASLPRNEAARPSKSDWQPRKIRSTPPNIRV